MPFPQFEPGAEKILYFSRGRGRSHAVQDMEIAREIQRLHSDMQIRFVSYGTGADTFLRAGVRHIDLDLPDRNPIHETMILGAKQIGWLKPDLVVSHEEFIVLPAAKIFDRPAVLLTDWFADPAKPTMTTLPFADRIIFLDTRGHFREPDSASGKVEYVGPVVRELRYTRRDREKVRAELKLPEESFIIAVLPGSSLEEESPSVDLVLAAFDVLPRALKHMVWVTHADYELIKARADGRQNVNVMNYDPNLERWMVAADVAITKGTRSTMRELERLSVPSVSFANNANPIDTRRAQTFPNNTALPESISAGDLAELLLEAAARPVVEPIRNAAGARACALSILGHFLKISERTA